MREHMGLFRGKRIDNGEWAYGYYVAVENHWHKHGIHKEWIVGDALANGGWFALCEKHAVIAETVGECTGLKDKNGKLIFEGDIIKTHYANAPKADFAEQVVFYGGRFCGMYERGKMKMLSTLADGIKHIPQDKSVYMEWCEVIGNIHDNPELLEGANA